MLDRKRIKYRPTKRIRKSEVDNDAYGNPITVAVGWERVYAPKVKPLKKMVIEDDDLFPY